MSTTSDRTVEATAHEEREWLRVTLSCIGDAVITTDATGNVTLLNPVAESLTGWMQKEAQGVRLGIAFNVLGEKTRKPVKFPTVRSVRAAGVAESANHNRPNRSPGNSQSASRGPPCE